MRRRCTDADAVHLAHRTAGEVGVDEWVGTTQGGRPGRGSRPAPIDARDVELGVGLMARGRAGCAGTFTSAPTTNSATIASTPPTTTARRDRSSRPVRVRSSSRRLARPLFQPTTGTTVVDDDPHQAPIPPRCEQRRRSSPRAAAVQGASARTSTAGRRHHRGDRHYRVGGRVHRHGTEDVQRGAAVPEQPAVHARRGAPAGLDQRRPEPLHRRARPRSRAGSGRQGQHRSPTSPPRSASTASPCRTTRCGPRCPTRRSTRCASRATTATARRSRCSTPAEVKSPLTGKPLPPFDTPTVDNHRGVEPYCTLTPNPCPLHDDDAHRCAQDGQAGLLHGRHAGPLPDGHVRTGPGVPRGRARACGRRRW